MKTVLILGGTGYLGQFAVTEFVRHGWNVCVLCSFKLRNSKMTAFTFQVAYTHHSTQAPAFKEGKVSDFWVDLASGEGLADCMSSLETLDVVINCAALSQPAVCESDVQLARSVNVPTKLLRSLSDWVSQSPPTSGRTPPLLIQISTDQVYDGSKSWWSEIDCTEPVNAYGRTKLEAEQAIQDHWPHHAIIRSSIIYGPQPPATTVSRALFLQFVDKSLEEGKPTKFFADEWRCPVHVDDIVATCMMLSSNPKLTHRVFNLGGPERLSRVDMAKAVAIHRGYSMNAIIEVPARSVDRGATSPADISMDTTLLKSELQIQPMSFSEGLKRCF